MPHATLQPTCVSCGNRDVDWSVRAPLPNRRPIDKNETHPAWYRWRTTTTEVEFGVCPGDHQERCRICDRLRRRRGPPACACRCAATDAAPYFFDASTLGSQYRLWE